jgi:glycosyltransferase involved in cell wall biosynthesis
VASAPKLNQSPPPLEGISVVVPAYGSSETLVTLSQQVHDQMVELNRPFEVIVVDDGSGSETWATIAKLAQKHDWFRGFQLMRNYGQHNALLAGIRQAQHPLIITMDDDLQHPPDQIPALIDALTPELNVVYGCPTEEVHGLARNLASVVTKLTLQNATGTKIARRVSAFRIFRTSLRDAFQDYNHPYVNIDVLLTWGTNRFGCVQVRRDERKIGESTYTLRKLIQHTFNMLTGFSDLPLKIASIIGFVLTFFGIGILFYVLGRYFWEGTSVPGFPFLASVIAIFSGAQLFAIGIIGEYLARIHFRSMNKPAYTLHADPDR